MAENDERSKLQVRISSTLKNQLADAATRSRRSLSAEVEVRLAASVAPDSSGSQNAEGKQ